MMLPLIDLVYAAQVPVARRYLQAVLTFEYRYRPTMVTSMLNAVTKLELCGIVRSEFDVGEPKPTHVYSLGACTEREERQIRSLIAHRQEYMRKNVLGDVGEAFVRSCLKWTKRFRGVTPLAKLGYRRELKHRVDILATEIATGANYAISVKNTVEWFHPGAEAIKDIWTKAEFHGAVPWLIVPFATPEAVERCANNARGPIRISLIGAQVLPDRIDHRSTRTLLRELSPLIGPQPFILHGARFDPSSLPDAFVNALGVGDQLIPPAT